jgi:hypothetical protein
MQRSRSDRTPARSNRACSATPSAARWSGAPGAATNRLLADLDGPVEVDRQPDAVVAGLQHRRQLGQHGHPVRIGGRDRGDRVLAGGHRPVEVGQRAGQLEPRRVRVGQAAQVRRPARVLRRRRRDGLLVHLHRPVEVGPVAGRPVPRPQRPAEVGQALGPLGVLGRGHRDRVVGHDDRAPQVDQPTLALEPDQQRTGQIGQSGRHVALLGRGVGQDSLQQPDRAVDDVRVGAGLGVGHQPGRLGVPAGRVPAPGLGDAGHQRVQRDRHQVGAGREHPGEPGHRGPAIGVLVGLGQQVEAPPVPGAEEVGRFQVVGVGVRDVGQRGRLVLARPGPARRPDRR